MQTKDVNRNEDSLKEINECLELFEEPVELSFMRELRSAIKELGSYCIYWSFFDYARGVFPTRLASWSRQAYAGEERQSKIDVRLYRAIICIVNGKTVVNEKIVAACKADGFSICLQDNFTVKIQPDWRAKHFPLLSRDSFQNLSEAMFSGGIINTVAQNKFNLEASGIQRRFKAKKAFLGLKKRTNLAGDVRYITVWSFDDGVKSLDSSISVMEFRQIINELKRDDDVSRVAMMCKNIGLTVSTSDDDVIEILSSEDY